MECPSSLETKIDTESLQIIGENAIRFLNDFGLYDENYLPALARLAAGVDQKALSRVLEHGTSDNLRKCLKKASAFEDGAPRESETDGNSKSESYLRKEAEAMDFLVSNTKEKGDRLVTRETIPQLYAKYLGSVNGAPLCYDSFANIYHDLRVIRDKHCETSIYTCVLCDDQFPIAKKLMEILEPGSRDYLECKIIYDRLLAHKEKQRIQKDYFQTVWNHPPEDSVIIAEDAGKRFVNEGKGVVHVMMIRWRENLDIHEHHYFFCIQGNDSPTVSRYSIAQSWLTFRSLNVLKDTVKRIYVFHDGGTNEYNNSSGLLLYASLQRLWNISFTVICFVAYHGKGLWDGLIGNAATIMSSRASLIKIVPELHFNQVFYYRAFASINGIAEQSKSFGIHVCASLLFGFHSFSLLGEFRSRVECQNTSRNHECEEVRVQYD